MGTFATQKMMSKIPNITGRGEIKIIHVIRDNGTWAAYRGFDGESFHYILAEGQPVTQDLAEALFPEAADKGLEYRS